MRTRRMKYSDYGITICERERLFNYCKNMTPEEKEKLEKIAKNIVPGMEEYICRSLCDGDGFVKQESMGINIPSTPEDFYAYRRKVLAVLRNNYEKTGKYL